MNKCWLLLKIQLLGFFQINRLIHTKDKKEKRQLITMGIVMGLVVLMMVAYSSAVAIGVVQMGLAESLPPIILLICAAITLILTFLKSNGVLFGFNDYDMVMSLPVKSQTVIISRLLSVYVMNVLISGVIMLPSIIIYGVTFSVSLSVWCMLLLSLFLASLLPMMAAMVVGAAITAVSVRFRYKNLLTIVLSMGLILLFLGASMNTSLDDSDLTAMASSLTDTIYRSYPLAKSYTNGIAANDWGSYGLFAFLSIGPSMLFVFILSRYYSKLNSLLFTVQSKKNYQLGTLKRATPFMALYTNELRRFVSIPIYVLNTCLVALLMIAASVAMQFINLEQIEQMVGLPNVLAAATLWAPWAMALFTALAVSTTSAISLEGKSRWLTYSAPVKSGIIYLAKVAVSLTYLVPAILISASLISIKLQTNAIETAGLFAVPLVFSILMSFVGLTFNMRFPKYDWTSEQQVVKQSLPVIATAVTGILLAAVIGFAGFFLQSLPFLALVIEIGLMVCMIIVIYRRLLRQRLYV